MSHARAWVAMFGVAALGVACSMDGDSLATAAPDGRGADGGGSQDPDLSPGNNGAGQPSSDGILIVHAASFPSFRLCFEGYPELKPQPDATVMPEANAVGVAQGSLVRIPPLGDRPLGKVHVAPEPSLRVLQDRETGEEPTCGAIFPPAGTGSPLIAPGTFLTTEPIDRAIGKSNADLLVIHGCGIQRTLDNLEDPVGTTIPSASSAQCGEGWQAATGNLGARVIPLQATSVAATDQTIPVQLFNLSPASAALGGTLAVNFEAPGRNTRALALESTFEPGPPIQLEVNQDDLTSYGSHAFVVAVTKDEETVTARQSLADVQALSAPSETPSSYYRTASNYALLVLGDPSHRPTLPDGRPHPNYNARRGLHVLAVSIMDPTKIDAGSPDASADGSVP